jgi:hypothetical protein
MIQPGVGGGTRGRREAEREGGATARGRKRVGAGKEVRVCVVTDNLGGQCESGGDVEAEREGGATARGRKRVGTGKESSMCCHR